jgi:hypothetical protein
MEYNTCGAVSLLVNNFPAFYEVRIFITRDPFEKSVDWRQCAVMQREAVIVVPSCSGRDNVVVV